MWARKYNKCIKCGTTKTHHKAKGLCIKCYKKSHHEWSRKYKCCIKCGTAKIRHMGNGLCKRCYNVEYGKTKNRRIYMQSYSYTYKRKNKLVINLQNKKYRATHKKEIKIRDQKYREENQNKLIQISRDYYYEHREMQLYRQKLYNEQHCKLPHVKNMRQLYQQQREARKKSVDFWTDEMTIRWWWMLDATESYCPVCGEPFDNGTHKCSMDHIIPLTPKSGDPQGIHHISNVQVLCKSCNSSKGNKFGGEK